MSKKEMIIDSKLTYSMSRIERFKYDFGLALGETVIPL